MKNIDIPDDSKRLVFEATKNGKPVFSEVVYDGLTKQEIINQINKSLSSSLTETADIFVNKSMDYGMDPYLVVAISLLETGCKWGCSYLTKECNNVGGMKGSGCGSYGAFNTLDDGIRAFIDNISRNYVAYGLTTADLMNPKYAENPAWSTNVNNYINLISSYIQKARQYISNQDFNESFKIIQSIIEAYNDTNCLNCEEYINSAFPELGMLLRVTYRKATSATKLEIKEWISKLENNKYYNNFYLEDIVLTIKYIRGY